MLQALMLGRGTMRAQLHTKAVYVFAIVALNRRVVATIRL